MPHRLLPCVVCLVALASSWPGRADAQDARPKLVRVELDEPGTALQQVENYGTGQSWWYGSRILCGSPCDANVYAEATYQIVGDGIPTSRSFRLPATDSVTLHVKRGDSTGHTLGGILAIGGAMALAVATVILIGAASHEHSGSVTSGLVTAGAGGVLLGVGLPIMLGNATTVRFE